MNTPNAESIPQAGAAPVSPKASKRPRRARPLTSKQIWPVAIRPIVRARDKIKKAAAGDPALPEIVKQLDAMVSVLFDLLNRRQLAEAQAQDRGEICWTVIHPRDHTIFGANKIVTRTPHSIRVKNEYFTIPDSPARVVDPRNVWTDLEKEWHRAPLDLAVFNKHAAYVDNSYRRFLAKGGPEKEAA